MACNNCLSLDESPECSATLSIGTIAVDTEVYIYVKNTFTDYIHRQEALSDGAGALALDLAKPISSFYNQDSSYELWVTLRTDNVKLTFTVDEVAYTCFNLSFHGVNDTSEL